MSKINTKEANQNKVNYAKTVENIQHEPFMSHLVILFSFQGVITRKLEFKKWEKIDPDDEILIILQLTSTKVRLFQLCIKLCIRARSLVVSDLCSETSLSLVASYLQR